MNTIRTILFLLVFPVCIQAQHIAILAPGGKVVNNDTLLFTPDVFSKPPYAETKCVLYPRNTGTTAMNMGVKKTDIILSTGAEHGICFAGQCYPFTVAVSPNNVLVAPGSTDTGFSAHYRYDTSKYAARKDLVAYTFYDANNPSDSAIVYAIYNFLPATAIASINIPSFSIYPNPCNGTFSIQTAYTDFKNASVQVYDMVGRLIKSQPLVSKSETISLNYAPKGVYTVNLCIDNTVLTQRMIIE